MSYTNEAIQDDACNAKYKKSQKSTRRGASNNFVYQPYQQEGKSKWYEIKRYGNKRVVSNQDAIRVTLVQAERGRMTAPAPNRY